MKTVYFIRHGETVGNIGKYYQDSETELSAAGHAGAKALAERFASVDLDTVFSSPYKRAQQTATYIAEIKGLQSVVTIESAHEAIHPVSVRGQLHESEISQAYKRSRKAGFWQPDWQYEEAENYQQVVARIKNIIAILEADPSSSVVLVSHASFLRIVFSYLLSQKSDDQATHLLIKNSLSKMANVGITEFSYDDNHWSLVLFNDRAHFAD